MRTLTLFSALALICAHPIAAEDNVEAPLTPDEQQQVIENLAEPIEKQYVYAENSEGIVATIRSELAAGSYAEAKSPAEFARLISSDLVEATSDEHFVLSHQPAQDGEELFETDDLAKARKTNFGFERLAILPGNVGYMRFDYFPDPDPAYAVLGSAMKFVENTEALIIDLRYNNGGYLETAQFIASHLFDAEKDRALFRYFYNDDGETIRRSQWVLAAIPGRRRPNVPVYILTSSTSFSAAEWMAFSLQELGRATVIGQTSTGAAHPVERFRIDDRFVVQVPIGKIFGPISGKDFEGKGVVPDHTVPSHRAHKVAYEMALAKLAEGDDGADAAWHLAAARAHSVPQDEIARDISAIQGAYEGRTFTLEDGTVIYRWRDRYSLAMMPLGNGLFGAEGTEDYRFQLVYENGSVTGIERVFRDGNSVFHKRID